jgi:hypothetical protein
MGKIRTDQSEQMLFWSPSMLGINLALGGPWRGLRIWEMCAGIDRGAGKYSGVKESKYLQHDLHPCHMIYKNARPSSKLFPTRGSNNT